MMSILSEVHGHSARPGDAFTGQNLKFTGHLPSDWLLFAGLMIMSTIIKQSL